MKNMPKAEFTVPSGLCMEDQLMLCIGRLVAEWAVCESLIWGLFQSFTYTGREDSTTAVLWLSTRGTGAKVTLVERLAAASQISPQLLEALKSKTAAFGEITKTRNFFCHAWYAGDRESMELKQIESHKLRGDAAVTEREEFTVATIEKASSAVIAAGNLSHELWAVLHDVRVELGLPNGSYILQHAGA